jgi:hypothetical protein
VKPRSFGGFNIRSKRAGGSGAIPGQAWKRRSPRAGSVTFKPSPVLVARVNGETIADEEE